MLDLVLFNRDDYEQSFGSVGDFIQALGEIDGYSRWETCKVARLKFMETGEPIEAEGLLPNARFSKETLLDTMTNTGMYIRLQDDDFLPLRDTAIKTVFERAKISGYVLKKLPKKELAKILNTCVKYAGGTALVRFIGEKVSAVHGGDRFDYVVLPMPELFTKTHYFFSNRYGPRASMKSAVYTHSLTTARWVLPEVQGEAYQIYKRAAEANGYSIARFVPTVRVTTSDVGISAATIAPMLYDEERGVSVRFCRPLKVLHKNKATMDKFEENLSLVFTRFDDSYTRMTKLIGIQLQHPANAMMGMMKKLRVPQKYGATVFENYKLVFGENSATAYQTYLALADILKMARDDGATESRLVELEELVAQALVLNWSDYDIPGLYNYDGKSVIVDQNTLPEAA